MGVVANIGYDKYPEQSSLVGTKVVVCFNYDPVHIAIGLVLRMDIEDPFETIFMLEDGRIVRSVECMFAPYEYKI